MLVPGENKKNKEKIIKQTIDKFVKKIIYETMVLPRCKKKMFSFNRFNFDTGVNAVHLYNHATTFFYVDYVLFHV